jgi:hypothetical protein
MIECNYESDNKIQSTELEPVINVACTTLHVTVLKWILERWDWMGWYGLDRSGSGYGPVEGSCEHGDEPSGSLNCWEVPE